MATGYLLDYVDFVAHVFLTERRAFYDIERLRKSARPLTPAEFDAELKEALAAKTRAARGKASANSQIEEQLGEGRAFTKGSSQGDDQEIASQEICHKEAQHEIGLTGLGFARLLTFLTSRGN